MSDKLLIGEIPYANLFPIFYSIRKNCDISNYEFVSGYPSLLNKMLRAGEIDVCPSSSVEYLKKRNLYDYINGHSISSFGKIRSILLFSRTPISDLNGQEIFVTHHSETSPVLLCILLTKFYGICFNLSVSSSPIDEALSNHSAYLSIGDDALTALNKCHNLNIKDDTKEYVLASIDHRVFYIYDLGELWYRHTGLPFVFALWMARKELTPEKETLLAQFKNDLDKAKDNAMKGFNEFARNSVLKQKIGANNLISYWNRISYDLGEEHKKGLELFGKYAEELRLL